MGPPFKTPPSLEPPTSGPEDSYSLISEPRDWVVVCKKYFYLFLYGNKIVLLALQKGIIYNYGDSTLDPCIQLCLVLSNTEHRPNPILGFLPNDWKLKTAMPLRAQSENIL